MNPSIQSQTGLPVFNLPRNNCNSCHEARDFSYQEVKSTAISITTDEGDVVTLSSAGRQETDFSLDYWQNETGRLTNFTTSNLNAGSFDFSVQGDLNDKELGDIAALMEDLSDIAGDFFSGNLDEAMTGALNINELGSLANLSATFFHSQSLNSTCLSENHPIPAHDLNGVPGNDLKNMLKNAQQDEISYAEMMRAQWQQIKNFIEDIQQEEITQQDKPVIETDDNLGTAEKMVEQINKFAAAQPRLTPFAVPLAHLAVDQHAAKYPSYQSSGLRDRLNHDIMQKVNDWLIA